MASIEPASHCTHERQGVSMREQGGRIRGRTLQKLRASVFNARPLCVRCEAHGRLSLATDLDHIKPLCKGGSNDLDNLQGLCAQCHKDKTAEDFGHRVRVEVGLDGWPVGA